MKLLKFVHTIFLMLLVFSCQHSENTAHQQPNAQNINRPGTQGPIETYDADVQAEPEETGEDAEPAAETLPDADETAQSTENTEENAEQQIEPAEPPSPIRVALYRAPGVSLEAHHATLEVLREAPEYQPTVLIPEQVRQGDLEQFHVVIFTGGRGSVQGESLEDSGRQIVRDFVSSGGGYIGVCAGSYLAMQGSEEFHKIAIVAAQNLTGDAWRRGVRTLEIQEVGSQGVHRLFYANGPVFQRVQHESIAPYVTLATYISETYLPAHGTYSGQMPGTPAILASQYGQGRIILFSPNPVLAADGESAVPSMMLDAVRWVATPGPLDPESQFNDVFR